MQSALLEQLEKYESQAPDARPWMQVWHAAFAAAGVAAQSVVPQADLQFAAAQMHDCAAWSHICEPVGWFVAQQSPQLFASGWAAQAASPPPPPLEEPPLDDVLPPEDEPPDEEPPDDEVEPPEEEVEPPDDEVEPLEEPPDEDELDDEELEPFFVPVPVPPVGWVPSVDESFVEGVDAAHATRKAARETADTTWAVFIWGAPP